MVWDVVAKQQMEIQQKPENQCREKEREFKSLCAYIHYAV